MNNDLIVLFNLLRNAIITNDPEYIIDKYIEDIYLIIGKEKGNQVISCLVKK